MSRSVCGCSYWCLGSLGTKNLTWPALTLPFATNELPGPLGTSEGPFQAPRGNFPWRLGQVALSMLSIHLVNERLLSTYYVLAAVLGTEKTNLIRHNVNTQVSPEQ